MEISILALPLIASIISGFFGKFIGDRNSEIVTSLLVSISAILSAIVFYEVIFNQYEEIVISNVSGCNFCFCIGSYLFNWIHVP